MSERIDYSMHLVSMCIAMSSTLYMHSDNYNWLAIHIMGTHCMENGNFEGNILDASQLSKDSRLVYLITALGDLRRYNPNVRVSQITPKSSDKAVHLSNLVDFHPMELNWANEQLCHLI